MFPYTDSIKNAVDMFPYTERANDIHSVLSTHVECVIRLQKVK